MFHEILTSLGASHGPTKSWRGRAFARASLLAWIASGVAGCSEAVPSEVWTLEWESEVVSAVASISEDEIVIGSSEHVTAAGAATVGAFRRVDGDGQIVWHAVAPGPIEAVSGRGGSSFAAGGTAWTVVDTVRRPDAWVGRFDLEGDAVWTDAPGLSEQEDWEIRDLALGADDSIVVVALVELSRTAVRRYDAAGEVLWTVTLDASLPRGVAWLDTGQIAVLSSRFDAESALGLAILSDTGRTVDDRVWADLQSLGGVVATGNDRLYVGATIRNDGGGEPWLSGLQGIASRWEVKRRDGQQDAYSFVNALAALPRGVAAAGSFATGDRESDLPAYRIWLAGYDRDGGLSWELQDDYRPIVEREVALKATDGLRRSPDSAGTFVQGGTLVGDGRFVLVGSSYPGPSWARSYALP